MQLAKEVNVKSIPSIPDNPGMRLPHHDLRITTRPFRVLASKEVIRAPSLRRVWDRTEDKL